MKAPTLADEAKRERANARVRDLGTNMTQIPVDLNYAIGRMEETIKIFIF